METRYLRINYEQALSARKELLSAELNSLNITKKLKEYQSLRKKELFLKNKLKPEFSNLKAKTNLIISTFPVNPENIPRIKKSKNLSCL